jgi:hypothetical protein
MGVKKQADKDEELQKEDAKRLYALFERRKIEFGITQKSFGEQHDWTAGNVSHYLNGIQPLNIDAAAKFAYGLGCFISDFSPSIAEKIKRYGLTERGLGAGERLTAAESRLLASFRRTPADKQRALLQVAAALEDSSVTHATDTGESDGLFPSSATITMQRSKFEPLSTHADVAQGTAPEKETASNAETQRGKRTTERRRISKVHK